MEKTNNKIFIYSPGFDKNSGGNSITHYLCDYLNKYSIFESYLIKYNEDTKTQMGSNECAKKDFLLNKDLINVKNYNFEFEINYENDFVIYNESIYGNPLNFKNVIRWILYFPNKTNYESYSSDDILLFYVEPYLRNLYELSDINYYHSDIIDYLNNDLNDKDLFFSIVNDNTEQKIMNNLEFKNDKFIFTRRKSFGIYQTPQYPLEDLENIYMENNLIENKPLNEDNISESFKEYNNFFSYDLYTYLNRLALKAGCNSYVYENKFIHKDDWKYNCKWMNGIKYGKNDPEECYYEKIDFEDWNIKNIKKFENIILRRTKFEKVKFTEPLINFYNKNGLSFNEINCNLCLTNFSIEIEFEIKSFDFKYQNLFDLNYKNINKGPRLEIDSNGKMSLVFIPNEQQDLFGYVIEQNIEINKKYFLKINFQYNKILYNINNNINQIITHEKNYRLNDLCICGGFNNERKFNNNILYSFKLYNYNIPILKEINYYLNDYNIFLENYPKKIFNCFYKYKNLDINYKYNFESIVLNFILNILPGDDNILINLDNKLILYYENKNIKIKIYENEYTLFDFEFIKKYDLIISIDFNNKQLYYSINKKINNLELIDNRSILINNFKINKFLNNFSMGNYNINNYLNFENINVETLVNFYYTFGFIKLNNLFINSNESMIKAFLYNSLNFSKNICDYIPQSMENLEYFVNIIVNKKIHSILEKIFKNNYEYTGSDSKIYNYNTNWHCDRKTKNHYLKCCFYLDKLNKENGCLRVLPGSQNSNDVYNTVLSKNAIPLFLGPGGFQKSFLNIKDEDIPSFNIETDFGDCIIFNLSLYHCAFNNNNNKKMICMNFSESYENINDNEKIECINSDFNIISNLKKSIDLNKKINVYNNNFIDYIKNNDELYNKYFKSFLECDSSLDKFVRINLDNNSDKSILKEFCNLCENTNNKKNK
jgi:ectoine hydroxylase-related dioxygenase (phytanoyl-CoA dioxygenase family)